MYKTTISLFILAFCSFLSLQAQGWEKAYRMPSEQFSQAADKTLDGGVIIAGTESDDSLGIERSFLYKTDANGVLQWTFYDTTHAASFVNTQEVISTSDGNYLTGIIYGDNPPDNDYVIQKISPSGTVLWQNDLTSSSFLEYVTDIKEAPDGGFVLLGIYRNSTGFNTVGLAKLSVDGIISWETTLTKVDLPMFTGEVIIAANGDLIVAGYFGFANDSQNVFIDRLTANGTLIWGREFNNTDNDFGLELLELPDGGIIIGGLSSTDFSLSIGSLQKLDFEGNSIWYKVYHDLGHQELGGLMNTPDGHIVVAGHQRIAGLESQNFYLMKVDTAGNELWTNQFGRSDAEYFAELLAADDQGYYLAGTTTHSQTKDLDVFLVKTDSLGNSLNNQLSGNLFHDANLDCLRDTTEPGLHQWLIEVTNDSIQYLALTDPLGNYSFKLDSGNYNLTAYPISPYWELCDTTFAIYFSGFNQNVVQDIPAQAAINCPLMEVSIGTPFLRRCFSNRYTLQYCNYGTTIALNAYVELEHDPYLVLTDASLPVASQMGNTIRFDLGDVEPGACGTVDLFFDLIGPDGTCDSIPLGATHCIEAHIYPDSICTPTNNWSGASIAVDARCQGDSIIFDIQNVGTAPTRSDLQYLVIEDDVILYRGTFNLDPSESESFSMPTNGATFRLEAEQEENHPGQNQPSVSVEGCGTGNTVFSFGFVTNFASNDGDPFVDIDCRQNIGSYDPNDKAGFPKGYKSANYIEVGQEIEYLVRFQNTGTDTAFNVVVLDTLSRWLDLSTVRPGASSHPYEFDISDGGVLSFTFPNIMLPDSNVNEPASNGFFKFKVAQQEGLELETPIYNTASIYFDFNSPIKTNQTLHTVGEKLLTIVSIETPKNPQAAVRVYPNPFSTQATIELEGMDIKNGLFNLYDVNGRLLRRLRFEGDQFVFDKESLGSGIYFFTIENDGHQLANGKLIAQ